MMKSFSSLLLACILAVSMTLTHFSPAYAASLPAEINQQFTPLQIDAGGVSILKITIFNPNIYPLTNAAFTNNLAVGLYVADPASVFISPSCGAAIFTGHLAIPHSHFPTALFLHRLLFRVNVTWRSPSHRLQRAT